MATATLTDGPAVQLTFPWALPKAEEEGTIVAERRTRSAARPAAARSAGRAARRSPAAAELRITVERHATAKMPPSAAAVPSLIEISSIAPSVIAEPTFAAPPQPQPQPVVAATGCAAVDSAQCATTQYATSVQEALCGDRIGKPVRMGAVMFRLLKRYGITDEEIAEGIAAYHAKRAARA